MRRQTGMCVLFVLAALVLAGCGEPSISAPEALEVVYMPLTGAVDVSTDVIPQIIFSADVDMGSVAGSIYLLQTDLSTGEGGLVCGTEWAEVETTWGAAEQDYILSMTDPALDSDSCYMLICTTGLKGRDLGPLENLGLCDKPGEHFQAVCSALTTAGAGSPPRVGAFAPFSTEMAED
ncbi:MAG: hypothetical protein JXR96_24480 [Deltaproteobacteria bacterium]|nr:hypothetical protein [Deltaproteobacteria bacterium]